METNDIKIIYEDEYFLVVDKPYGLVVNRSDTTPTGTLQDYLEEKYDFMKQEILPSDVVSEEDIGEFKSRAGIGHRLDKDTSGVLLVTKDVVTFKKIKEQFQGRDIKKEYVVIVMGEIKDEKLEIDAPIKRNPNSPLRFAVVAEGKPALTLAEKVKVVTLGNNKFTMLNVFPQTGRTHQIRVHMSAINHPIAGDPIYLTRFTLDLSSKYFNRLMLHAHKLSFMHPYTNKTLECVSSLPKEFEI